MPQVTTLHVNGKNLPVKADGERTLLSVLRDDLELTGTKYGCGEGECGACTVLIDGRAMRACLTPVREVSEKQIRTIEGLAKNGNLHPVQQAFLDAGAFQCGYCTSGMIMAAFELLERSQDPSPREIFRAMNGNICRCGTYQRILAAVHQAARALRHKEQ